MNKNNKNIFIIKRKLKNWNENYRCCNTCEAVKDAYRRKKWAVSDLSKFHQCQNDKRVEKMKHSFTEGCQIYGKMEVNRVAGSFHIAPGESFSINHIHGKLN